MRWTLIILALFLVSVGSSAPVPKEQPPPEERTKKPPSVCLVKLIGSDVTNWGKLTQDGRSVHIGVSKSQWEATGKFRDDGTVLLEWINLQYGWCGIGVYHVDEFGLVGVWGYVGRASVSPDGSLVGEFSGDCICGLD